MTYRTLDEIVHSILIQSGKSVHYYMQVLKFSSDCLRELQFDVLGNIKSKKLEANSYGAIELPCDYIDYIRIGTPSGQNIHNSGGVINFNRLVNIDETGQKVLYPTNQWAYGTEWGKWVYPNGAYPDYSYSVRNSGFEIIQERGEIQLSQYGNFGFLILDYITDGSEIDNAIKVHPYAQACIEAYVFWQLKAKNRTFGAGEANNEKAEYDRQYRILRGRKSDLTPDNVKAVISRYYGKQK